jgi:hypothetical protein
MYNLPLCLEKRFSSERSIAWRKLLKFGTLNEKDAVMNRFEWEKVSTVPACNTCASGAPGSLDYDPG